MMMVITALGLVFVIFVVALAVVAGVLLLSRSGQVRRDDRLSDPTVMQSPAAPNQPVIYPEPSTTVPVRYCANCGSGLQADWTHCPQCGAPVEP